jgi:hypothetical protein
MSTSVANPFESPQWILCATAKRGMALRRRSASTAMARARACLGVKVDKNERPVGEGGDARKNRALELEQHACANVPSEVPTARKPPFPYLPTQVTAAWRPSRSLNRSSSLLKGKHQVGCGYRPSWANSRLADIPRLRRRPEQEAMAEWRGRVPQPVFCGVSASRARHPQPANEAR